ncbi:hypothetical protein QQ054_15210 [Oscillatoria amoena NRMC-F 0135]|nr:hypothetical protein [Oscillatoria amoena NRMC-F 0135]
MILPIVFSLLPALWHPLHVSVTDIVYDERERELEVIMRIFVDDLETSIRVQRNDPELNLLNPNGGYTTSELVKGYVSERFAVSLDGKHQSVNFLGTQLEDDALLCFIQVKAVKKWKTIEVTNSVITETYDDQSNLVHVTVGEKVRSLRLMKDNPSGKISFN